MTVGLFPQAAKRFMGNSITFLKGESEMSHNPLSKRMRMGVVLVVFISLLIIGACATPFVFADTVKTPKFNPASGTYSSPQNVVLSCDTPGAIIRYTTDNTDPTLYSTVYSGPISVDVSTTIRARAFVNIAVSVVSTATYTLKVATPTFSPATGTYISAQNVTIQCATPNAIIRFTIDGSIPTSKSTEYKTPIFLNATTPVQAKAFKSGWTESNNASATYTIKVATPTFNPPSGTYSSPQFVEISCATPGATIRYTTNGVDPTSTTGTVYSDPVSIGESTPIKARAFASRMTDSDVAAATYTFKVATPALNPLSGAYSSVQNVIIQCATDGATIRYTVDGTAPSLNSNQYSGPISVNITTTIKAKAFKTGWTESNAVSETYTIKLPTVAKPTFSPLGGTYSSPQNVAISCATPGATITYTVDNSEPSSTSTLYSGPILVNATTTIKAKAFKNGMTDSDPNSATYTINIPPKVATPTFNPAEGTYTSVQVVAVQCATSGATIRYTVDGTEPSSSSPEYKTPISVNTTTTVKAKAFKSGWIDSDLASATYIINLPKVASPAFSPSGGTYSSPQNIALSCSIDGATIRFTSDGSEPTSSSTAYSSPIPISSTTTIKAKAFKSGMTDSDTAQATYTITPEQQPTKVSTPTFNPPAGTYSSSQNVALSCNTPDATIRYTVDGSEPSTSSPVYSSPILVSMSTTIKAKAFKNDMTDSDTAQAAYTITLPRVVTPTFTPDSGSYSGVLSVVIRCATPSAIIRYTTDGAEPSPVSLMYSGPITVTATTTIKAKAFMFSGMADSDTASATYTINTASSNQEPLFGNEVTYTAIAAVAMFAVVAIGFFYVRWRKRGT
jgi:Chitobiase/beta-hexosaminidase C-terminal domain